jgi:hypothetical protein
MISNINTALTAVDLLTRFASSSQMPSSKPTPASGSEPFFTSTPRESAPFMANGNPLVKSRLYQQLAPSLGSTFRAPSAQAPEAADRSWVQKASGDIARHTWFIPGLSNMLHGLEKSDGSVDGMMDGLKSGLDKTLKTGLATAIAGAAKGDWASVLNGYGQAVAHNESTPKSVKSTLGLTQALGGTFTAAAGLAGTLKTTPTGI